MDRAGAIIGLAVGILIGYNWPKIKKTIAPIAQGVGDQVFGIVTGGLRYAAEMKENLEDQLAEARAIKEESEPEAVPQGPDVTPTENAV